MNTCKNVVCVCVRERERKRLHVYEVNVCDIYFANTNGSLGLHVDVMQNSDVFSKWKVNINGEYLNSKHYRIIGKN